jgi:hypothetical protein
MGVKIGGGLTWDEVKKMDVGMDVCGQLILINTNVYRLRALLPLLVPVLSSQLTSLFK